MNTVEQSVFDTKDYKRSRNAYNWECAFEHFVKSLAASTFLANLLKYTGMNDTLIGIISSFATFAFLFQLLSVFVIQRITNTKRFAIIFHTAAQLLFASLYFIPLLPIEKNLQHLLMTASILLAYFGNYFVTSIIYKWGNSFVDPHKRASFSAGKVMRSLATGMAVTLIAGVIIDAFEAANNQEGGFIFVGIALIIFAISDFACLMTIKNDVKPKEEKHETVPMREVLRHTVGNKNFRNVIILKTLYCVSVYTTIGFLGTYSLSELAYTVATVQVINLVANTAYFLICKPLGRFSDKRTFARGIELGMIIAAVSFGFMIFTTPSTRFLYILFWVIYSMSQAGTGENFINITYSYVDTKYFVQASAIMNSISGILGFVASLIGGKILSVLQANGNQVFGFTVYGQQILALISLVLLIVAIIYNHFVIAKQKVMLQ